MSKQKFIVSKKRKKSNVSLRRKLFIAYNRFVLTFRIALFIFVFLFFCTDIFISIKNRAYNFLYDLSSDIGFRLNNVIIDGIENVAVEEVLKALNIDKGTPIFAINLEQAKFTLEKHSWIKFVAVERKLPDTIRIYLIERFPVAIWQLNQKMFLIDEDGRKISNYDIKNTQIQKFSHLLHVVGIDANIYAKKLIDDLSQFPELKSKIVAAIRYGGRRWNLNLLQNIVVKMPENDFNIALKYLVSLYNARKLFDQGYSVIDLRNSEKYYIEKLK